MKQYRLNQYRNKKTGERYYRLATGIDTTNERDGMPVVIYCPADNENTIYVREYDEFERNFGIKGKQKLQNIVDIHGLAEILLCSTSMINKTWGEYPHFFIGHGKTARGARFDVNDVLEYLKDRDYANDGQKNEVVDRSNQAYGVSDKKKNRIQNKNGSKKMGNIREREIKKRGRSGLLVFPGC